jgi:hypothetical protein
VMESIPIVAFVICNRLRAVEAVVLLEPRLVARPGQLTPINKVPDVSAGPEVNGIATCCQSVPPVISTFMLTCWAKEKVAV